MQKLVLSGRELPVMSRTDAIVIGGSFAGIAAAVEFARAGLSVTLVEPRTYLGREITATHRYWVNPQEAVSHELVAGCISPEDRTASAAQETALHPAHVKRYLEDILFQSKVKLLYASLPVRTIRDKDGIQGIIIANKSGMQVIEGKIVLDASETAVTVSPEDRVTAEGCMAYYGRVLEFDGVFDWKDMLPKFVSVPTAQHAAGGKLVLHPGSRGPGHVLVEFYMELPSDNTMQAAQKRESLARHSSMAIASYLIADEPAFQSALFAAASHELYGPLTAEAVSQLIQLRQESIVESPACGAEPAVIYPKEHAPIKGIWYTHFEADSPELVEPWLKAETSAEAGSRLARLILSQMKEGVSFVYQQTTGNDESLENGSIYEVRTSTSPQQGKPYSFAAVPDFVIPVQRKVDVLVAGGGTSGATAAITAAREGAETIVLELNSGLGGTGTLGGVDSYWFGRRVGFAERITQAVEQVHGSLHYKGHKWNIEAKMYALLREAETAQAELIFNSLLFGTVTENNVVKGVVAATRWGAAAFLSEVVLDATGDGDVAAFAGAEFVYGSERDHTVMWYSLAQFEKPGRTRNNFTSMVDVSNVEDYTRAIVTGRRRGNNPYEHGVYVATRESRHILGEVVMTLSDQMLHRSWPDVINLHFSNHDIKGVSAADWVNIGSIPPNLMIEIPYRMLLPRGLEGILVIGKALSATHDALPAIRMQSDLENLGGVAALAAVQAIREAVVPRHIHIDTLQSKLIEAELLPANTLTRRLEPFVYSDEELEALVDTLTGELPLYHYSNMRMNEVFTRKIPIAEIRSQGNRIVPKLLVALKRSTGSRQVQLAQALAMLEAPEAVPVLLAEIARLLEVGAELPMRRDDFMYVQLPPDHGAMPDVAYLLYSLGLTMDERSLPIWEQIVERLDPSVEDFKEMLKGTFYYVHAICSGAERLGSPKAIPLLLKLLSYEPLHGNVSSEGFQPDYFEERRSMLELTIARSLARCGSIEGYLILIDYLKDVRALLAEHAHEELKAISGEDFGKDASRWLAWLQEPQRSIMPKPYRKHLDMIGHNEVWLRASN